MAGGQIDGFFRKPRPGQPVCSLADVDNLNRVANILNDITGEGCSIDKPTDGTPWTISFTGSLSDNVPLLMPQELRVDVDAVNDTSYRSDTDSIFPHAVNIAVNGISVSPSGEQPISWNATAGVKYLLVIQRFSTYTLDADGQYTNGPYYNYCTDTSGLGYEYALIAKIPWCRVEIPVVGEPPKIKNLLEGPLRIYAYRGDADTRAYAPTPANPQRQIQKSKTVDNSSGGSLPVKVRNLTAATDGFFNEYPYGRYKIEDGEVVWLEPDETAVAKNAAKALLLRYIDEDLLGTHGQPYWMGVDAFKQFSATWVEEYVTDELDNTTPTWLIAILRPWALEIWSEDPGPFEDKCPDTIDGKTVLAAVMGDDGEWKSIVDIVVTEEEFELTLDDWEDLRTRADGIVDEVENAETSIDEAGIEVATIEDTVRHLEDFSTAVATWQAEALSEARQNASMDAAFQALDARITALEQRP